MEKIRLDAFCSSVRDGTHDTPKPVASGRYLVTSKAIRNNSVFLDECYFISQKDFDQINKRSLVEKWDVLMTMIGSVGRLLLVKEQPNYAIKNIALFKVGEEIKAKWLYYYLSNPSVQNYFELIASGTSQHFIGLGHLRKLRIDNIDDSSEKIVNILSAYDNLIENNNKRIRLLEQMAENLYKEWFVRFRFPGHEKVEMENGLPKGWKIERVKAIVKRLPFNRTYKEEELEKTGKVVVIDQSTNDVLGYHNNEPSHYANYNNPLMVFGDHSCKFQLMTQNFSLGENVIPFTTCDNSVVNEYWLFYATHKLIKTEEYKRHWGRFSSMKVLIPKIGLQNKFADIIVSLEKEKNKLKAENDNLTRQRDLLLPRLMSGKLEVKE